MTRDQFLQRLRKFARKNDLILEIDKKGGKGSHYRIKLDGKVTTVQKSLNEFTAGRILDQLNIDRSAF